jgi:hypothetical protein
MNTTLELDLEALGISPEDLDPFTSTAEQRRALYRMGRSRSWVKKYASTRTQAHQCIQTAIQEMTKIKTISR